MHCMTFSIIEVCVVSVGSLDFQMWFVLRSQLIFAFMLTLRWLQRFSGYVVVCYLAVLLRCENIAWSDSLYIVVSLDPEEVCTNDAHPCYQHFPCCHHFFFL